MQTVANGISLVEQRTAAEYGFHKFASLFKKCQNRNTSTMRDPPDKKRLKERMPYQEIQKVQNLTK